MEKKDLRIVYMGTPDFAVLPLKRIIEAGFQVVGVVTNPDKPAGRGQQLQESAVKKYAREIGLKKALGARRRTILGQFLTEAAMLSSIGGLLGIIAGIILARVISMIAAVPVAISTPAILVAVVFSMVVGIIFGLVPSVKAANLNPIDALRYE